MNFYWVYDIPSWLFALLTITVYMLFGLIGVSATRKVAKRLHQTDHSHNNIVSYFLAAVTVFYGITLDLVTIGTWDTFSSVNTKVDTEAQLVTSLYHDADNFQEPLKSQLHTDLQHYLRNVIDVSWPLQRKGLRPY